MSISNYLPDFIIIGAGKSGTTSLDKYLQQHPDIYMSPKKEPNFFGYEGIDPETFKLPETRKHFYGSITKFEDYQKLFEAAPEGTIKGEVSNLYLYSAQAYQKIRERIPHVRLIAILRNPAERLYSRFLHLARDNQKPTENFEDLFDKNSIWWERPDLVNEGFYYKHLRKFYDLFPPEQIKVVFYENLKSNPTQLLQEILAFIGANPSFVPNFETQFNKSGIIKNKFINSIIGREGIFSKGIKLLPQNIYQSIKNNPVSQKWLNHFRNKNLTYPRLSDEIKSKIIKEIYLEDIQNLEKLLDVDLQSWTEIKHHEQV